LDDVNKDDTRTHWIAGYAGTGKTLVITHLIERIIARTQIPYIYFLTYTYALKKLVHSGLSQRALARVTIQTVDNFLTTRENFDYILVDEIQDRWIRK
jgi:ATP-dependent exoDNAse (exonuclease V) beta subunit